MLEIEKRVIGKVPLLTLKGRFDSYGATVFEQQVAFPGPETVSLVLDVSQVGYLSSMGVRSLLKLDKALKGKGGIVVLLGAAPFLKKVLELSGVLGHFASASTLEEALGQAKRTGPPDTVPEEVIIEERRYRIWNLGKGDATLDMWGNPALDAGDGIGTEDLVPVSLPDLGMGFGIGGFGADREGASQALGEFVAAGGLAGVLPADRHGVADYLLAEELSGAEIFIASAAGFSGRPCFYLECDDGKPISLQQLVDQVLDATELAAGARSALFGMAVLGETRDVLTSRYARPEDVPAAHPTKEHNTAARGLLLIGIVGGRDLERSPDGVLLPWFLNRGCFRTGRGNFFHGHAFLLNRLEENSMTPSLEDNLLGMKNLDLLSGTAHLEPETEILRPRAWLYRFSEARPGSEKLLKVEVGEAFLEPWDEITRMLFPDAARVVMDPLTGGYMGKTFRAIPYAPDGRRMLPSVLKLGPETVIDREVRAFHESVEKYILNNSTSIMGRASSGEWGGIRYTFVGISGPESRLTWLAEHYRSRATEDLLALLERLFTQILKPWYGQPRWEEIRPYEEHNPLILFPRILEDGETVTGVSAEAEVLPCPELNLDLPNPFRFLKHGYPARKDTRTLWYRCITHGDLNLQNVLVDERENLYIIDFSETRVRNAVSDFARLEAIVKIEMARLEGESDLKALLEFEAGLVSPSGLGEAAPIHYSGDDPMVEKAYRVISLLRGYADRVTLFEENILPYLLALLEWTYPVVSYRNATPLQKRFAAYSAGLIVRRILELEARQTASR
ncbi:MAG: STAS domain-containing protein [Deltaproteobacteria bacterium]|nr:STAS domain-containing protein [Deltaproteobacteria bacterium]